MKILIFMGGLCLCYLPALLGKVINYWIFKEWLKLKTISGFCRAWLLGAVGTACLACLIMLYASVVSALLRQYGYLS